MGVIYGKDRIQEIIYAGPSFLHRLQATHYYDLRQYNRLTRRINIKMLLQWKEVAEMSWRL